MFSVFGNAINYNESDSRTIVTSSLKKIQDLVGEEIYITASKKGTVTKSQAKLDIARKLEGKGKLNSL